MRFWLLDNVSLDRFIEAELTYGLGLAVEAKVLTDINATSLHVAKEVAVRLHRVVRTMDTATKELLAAAHRTRAVAPGREPPRRAELLILKPQVATRKPPRRAARRGPDAADPAVSDQRVGNTGVQ